MGHKHNTTVEGRFWAKVEKADCWLWIASTINGYGQYVVPELGVKTATQFSWWLRHGSLPDGRIVQSCGNKACVRWDHLVTGTEGRFWLKVDKNGPVHPTLGQCWQWTGARESGPNPYSRFTTADGRTVGAHRYSYELAYGPITPGMDVDHCCRNRLCVRPQHLREATRKQNAENQGVNARSKTGIRGVYLAGYDWLADAEWYGVQVRHNGQKFCGGFFTDIELAEKAAVELRNRLYTHNDGDRVPLPV